MLLCCAFNRAITNLFFHARMALGRGEFPDLRRTKAFGALPLGPLPLVSSRPTSLTPWILAASSCDDPMTIFARRKGAKILLSQSLREILMTGEQHVAHPPHHDAAKEMPRTAAAARQTRARSSSSSLCSSSTFRS